MFRSSHIQHRLPLSSIMSESFSDLSPSASLENTSRLHPALQATRSQHLPVCPSGPQLRPQPNPRIVPDRWRQLPETFNTKDLDRYALYEPSSSELRSCYWGMSPRLWWTLFKCWEFRCRQHQALSLPVLGLMSVYLDAYLFNQESPEFIRCLRNFLAVLLPADAPCPDALRQLLFYGMHSFYLQRRA